MPSAIFFPTRWPTSTFAPGLHNLEIHADQSSSARGWSATKNAILLQALYARLPNDDTKTCFFLHYDGDLYMLGRGSPLLVFLNEIEAKYREVTVIEAWMCKREIVSAMITKGVCDEELVPGSQNRGDASQFAWAFRWGFKKCIRSVVGREDEDLVLDVD